MLLLIIVYYLFCLSTAQLRSADSSPSLFPIANNLNSQLLPHQQLSSTVQIRLATFDDIQQIAGVLTRSFHNFNDWMCWVYPLVKLGVCEDLRTRFQTVNPYYNCLVAVIPSNSVIGIKEQVIATVELSVKTRYHWQGKTEYPYLANLAVSADYRHQGVGTKLLKHCEHIAHNWGFKQIYLHVVANNYQGQQLYLRNGYTIQQVEIDLYSLFITSQRRLLLTKSIRL